MIERVSIYVANWLASEGNVSNDDHALYKYATYSFLFGMIPVAISVLCGIFMGIIGESLLLMIPFILIRKFSGGYHLESSRMCFLLSLTVIVAACGLLKWLLGHVENYIGFTSIVFLAFCSLWFFSPIDSDARKLRESERRLFRKIAQLLSSITLLIYCLLLINQSIHLAVPTGLGLVIAAFLQFPCLLRKTIKWK